MRGLVIAAGAAVLLAANAAIAQGTETHVECTKCKDWNTPQKPFNIVGNTWYVGTTELSSVLITGPQGAYPDRRPAAAVGPHHRR